MNDIRKSILRRALKGLVSLALGGAVAAVGSPAFRDFLGDADLGIVLYAIVPSLVLAADKAWRSRSK